MDIPSRSAHASGFRSAPMRSRRSSILRVLRAAATAALLLAALAGACARGRTPAERSAEPGTAEARLLEGLGRQHHPITTTSPLAQRYFDQGLALAFAFNHDAAIRSFEAGLAEDPGCA